jgi:phage terminase Nu1 subunit (DNA packaging protein)
MTRGAKRYLPEKVTSKQLGEAVGRKPSTIGNWVSEGLLAPLDHDGPVGSPRYDLLDGLLAAHTKGIDLTQLVTRIPPTLVPRWNALADESADGADGADAADAADAAGAPDDELKAEKVLLTRAQRELAEQRLQERRGQLLDAARTRNAIGSAMVAVRERIMAIETRAHGQMGAEEHAWLAVELRTALAEAYGSAERVMVDLMGEPADDDTADGDA